MRILQICNKFRKLQIKILNLSMPNRQSYHLFLENLYLERRHRFTQIIIWFGFVTDLIFYIHDRIFDQERVIKTMDTYFLIGYFLLAIFSNKIKKQTWIAPLLLITSYFWIFFNCLIYGKDSELELFFITIPAASIFVVDFKNKVTLFLLFALPILALIALYGGAYNWQPYQTLDINFLNRTAFIAIVMNMTLVILFSHSVIRNHLDTNKQLADKNNELLEANDELTRINQYQQKDNLFLDQRIDEVVAELRKKERETTLKLIQNEENQKQRIAQELHDSVGVLLSTAKLSLENHLQEDQVKLAHQLVDTACKEVRAISHEMTPPLFEKLGLVNALSDFQELFSQNNSVQLELFVKDYDGALGFEKELVLYRVISEVVNNSIKHALCTTISVQLMARDNQLIVSVEDDGRGFDVYDVKQGLGISSIKQRVMLLNGTHTLESIIDSGTAHLIEIPL